MIIFLTGFMGCGKTSLGRKVALRTGLRFVDMDREIERRSGMKVSEIFARYGENGFRRMERELLERLVAEPGPMIVSTGGGVPCHGDNMELMNRSGRTVYLKMCPSQLAARLESGRDKRPKIRGMNDRELLAFISETLPMREEYYNLSHLIIDCDGVSDDYICNHIVSHFYAPGKRE